MTVPECGDSAFLPLSAKEQIQCGFYGRGVGTYEFVGTHGASLWSFGVIAQGDTWYSHHGGLFGDTARVGNYCLGAFHEGNKRDKINFGEIKKEKIKKGKKQEG